MTKKTAKRETLRYEDCSPACRETSRGLFTRHIFSRARKLASFYSLIAAFALCVIAIETRGQTPDGKGSGPGDSSEETAQDETTKNRTESVEESRKGDDQGDNPPTKDGPSNPFDLRTTSNLTGDWGGLRSELKDHGVTINLYYNQQFQQNTRGGLETHNGHRLSGSYDLKFDFDFAKMGLIENAGFAFECKGTWSDGINPDKVGAIFNVNSDAGGDHPIFVNKWWYWQRFFDKRLELRLGRLETNKDLFDVSLYANHEDKDFLNRLSIRNGTIPHITGIGAFAKYSPVDWFYVQAAGVDSQSRARRTGFDTAFHNQAWFIGIAEAGFTPKWNTAKGPMPGRYRIGVWYDPKTKTQFRNTLGGRRRAGTNDGDVGYYIGLDQMIWKEQSDQKDSQGLGVFGRYGHARSDRNRISDSWELGASIKGLVPTRDNDVMAFAVSQGIESERYRDQTRRLADRETVYEWYYAIQVAPWLIVSPDFQVIQNPGGDTTAHDSIVGGVRVRVIF